MFGALGGRYLGANIRWTLCTRPVSIDEHERKIRFSYGYDTHVKVQTAQSTEILYRISTGGGTYLLAVQCFSVLCLFLWGLLATYPILWFVNKVLPIRLSPEDEIKGCDLTEHYMGDESEKMLPTQHMSQAHQAHSIRFAGMNQANFDVAAIPYSMGDKYKEFDTLGKRRPFSTNLGYEHDDHQGRQQTSDRL